MSYAEPPQDYNVAGAIVAFIALAAIWFLGIHVLALLTR